VDKRIENKEESGMSSIKALGRVRFGRDLGCIPDGFRGR
jgi:hypothetical protein